MGGPNKLLATFDGVALVRRVCEAAVRSRADPVIVVTGERAGEIGGVLAGLAIKIKHNPDHRLGLSRSIVTGLDALADVAPEAAGVLIILADMPGMSAELFDRLIDVFDPAAGTTIVVPTTGDRQGNPVLWGRDHFADLRLLTGDSGAKSLIGRKAGHIHSLEVGAAAAIDVDTPDEVRAAGGVLRGNSDP